MGKKEKQVVQVASYINQSGSLEQRILGRGKGRQMMEGEEEFPSPGSSVMWLAKCLFNPALFEVDAFAMEA